MPTKTKVRHRVTFAPDTKTETEQLDCLVRAIEFKGPGIDELSNMIQNIHIGYTENKRKPSFDSTSIIAQLRNTLDNMLDSELAETSIKSSSSDCGSLKDEVTSKENTTLSKPSLSTIEENNEKQFKASHDSGVSDIEFDLEKIKNNEVSPQARRRVSGLINKLDTCINELQRVTDTIEEETPSEVQACLNDVKETGKEALPTKVDGNALFSEPMDAGYYTANTTDYLYNEEDMNNYSLGSTEDTTRLDLVRKGIYAIPNQPTVIEACYSGFLLSSILTVVADDCSVLYFGILTENNLYFYNSTDDNEPMFGRIVIDQNTKVVPISSHDNQGYLIEINGIYVLPDNQFINSKVRIKFNSKQERNIWYKVIKTTVNDWKIRTSYNNNSNQTNTDGRKRRLSFLSSIQLQPLYLENTPKRSDSLHRSEGNNNENLKPASKKASELSESTVISPDVENVASTNAANNSPPDSATTITPEENYNINPSQSILSALHVLEALERKRTIQELKK